MTVPGIIGARAGALDIFDQAPAALAAASDTKEDSMDLSRRDVLRLGGAALAGTAITPSVARAQAPKRGGTLSLRLWDPPHFDLHAAGGLSYKLHVALSLTHSRLVRPKAGPGIQPGTFPLEGDLAESWTQPNETTYVFKLRKGCGGV
jgi:ABC-type transport system substrate-binding protein